MVESTERPDRVVGALMDGRIAIIVQGTPFVILLPFVFLQAFQVGRTTFGISTSDLFSACSEFLRFDRDAAAGVLRGDGYLSS